MIPLMENKIKWDRPKKKKKFPSIEIEMTSTNYDSDEKITEEVPIFKLWPTKHNGGSSDSHRTKEHSFTLNSGDSGIESIQASPAQKVDKAKASSSIVDIYDVPGPSTSRRYSSVYLHPDRARFNYSNITPSLSRDQNAIEDNSELLGGVSGANMSGTSSNASSLTSVAGATGPGVGFSGHSDPWGRRRSSTWTGRYSDGVDPEFANLRMATRGSVGMQSLSDSLHKLTFTQSLAFPELARKLANRRRQEQIRAAINDTSQDDFEACSKFVAVAGVFLLSLMVYGVVNKYGKV